MQNRSRLLVLLGPPRHSELAAVDDAGPAQRQPEAAMGNRMTAGDRARRARVGAAGIVLASLLMTASGTADGTPAALVPDVALKAAFLFNTYMKGRSHGRRLRDDAGRGPVVL
jgi:hypothetical protein